MPTIFGNTFPEIESVGKYNSHLRVLVCTDGDHDAVGNAILRLSVLTSYLSDIADSAVSISIFIPEQRVPDWLTTFKDVLGVPEPGAGERVPDLRHLAAALDVDFVTAEDSAVASVREATNSLSCPLVTLSEVLREAEIIVRGHDIPWSFDNPVWYMPWSAFYSMTDRFGQELYNTFAIDSKRLSIDEATLENLRSLLLNRTANLCFTRDRLLFICQQRDFASRHGWKRQCFAFEAGYYLSHYFHELWGGMEQLARILEANLGLNISNRIRVSVGNPQFIAKVVAKDQKLGHVFTESDFTRWIGNVKLCRDHIAHAGAIVLSPLARRPDSELSGEELDSIVRGSTEYTSIMHLVPPDKQEEHLAMLRANVLARRLEVARDDALVISNDSERTLLFPLQDTRWHFDNYRNTLLLAIKRLQELRGDDENHV